MAAKRRVASSSDGDGSASKKAKTEPKRFSLVFTSHQVLRDSIKVLASIFTDAKFVVTKTENDDICVQVNEMDSAKACVCNMKLTCSGSRANTDDEVSFAVNVARLRTILLSVAFNNHAIELYQMECDPTWLYIASANKSATVYKLQMIDYDIVTPSLNDFVSKWCISMNQNMFKEYTKTASQLKTHAFNIIVNQATVGDKPQLQVCFESESDTGDVGSEWTLPAMPYKIDDGSAVAASSVDCGPLFDGLDLEVVPGGDSASWTQVHSSRYLFRYFKNFLSAIETSNDGNIQFRICIMKTGSDTDIPILVIEHECGKEDCKISFVVCSQDECDDDDDDDDAFNNDQPAS